MSYPLSSVVTQLGLRGAVVVAASLTFIPSLSACGLIFAYTVEGEDSAETCSDAADNDGDQTIDCDDLGCDGFCPELALDECGDGRDNDGDGLADEHDASCWALRAPHAERCTEERGVELIETFDTVALGDNAFWHTHGFASELTGAHVGALAPRTTSGQPGVRQDGAWFFRHNTTGSSLLGDNLGSLVRQEPFAGSWQGFGLRFSALVPARAVLRAALVPLELAPTFDPPRPGAESALLALTLDTTGAPATLTLDVEGAQTSTSLPSVEGLLCDGLLCDTSFARVELRLDEDGFLAQVSYPDGSKAQLRAASAPSPRIPPSKLVLWGGTTDTDQQVGLDDLSLRILPEQPCGLAVPQIPGASCAYADDVVSFGEGLALSRLEDGDYCALVSSSHDAAAGPDGLWAWTSSDGSAWSPASSEDAPPFELPEDAVLIGVGMAADDEGFHAAAVYRSGETVQLGFVDAESCGDWASFEPGPELPSDAEAPSYLIRGDQHEVYFTRAPRAGAARSLYRLRRSSPEGDPKKLTELPADVEAPVSVSLVGSVDPVLIYPNRSPEGAGVGLLVGSEDGKDWQPVAASLLLALPSKLGPYDPSLSFDDRGLAAAALLSDADGSVLLYAGTSAEPPQPGLVLSPLSAVGSARFLLANEKAESRPVVPEPACGDGMCVETETCATCPADCECSGVELLSDVFGPDAGWKTVSSDSRPSRVQYLGTDPPALNFAGGLSTWSVLPLEQALQGDFELSFDLSLAMPESESDCPLYVGLGTAPEADENGDLDLGAGIFARFAQRTDDSCAGVQFSALPFVRTESQIFGGTKNGPKGVGCRQELAPGQAHRVVLRREAGQVSVSVTRGDACGTVDTTLDYGGGLPDLPALLVGFSQCDSVVGGPTQWPEGGSITNVSLRLLDDPEHCPKGKKRCEGDSAAASCVDTTASPEHCGACGKRCPDGETCQNGVCSCDTLDFAAACGGQCVNTLTSAEHCGECGHACPEGAACAEGDCECLSPLLECGDTCADILTSREHCGGCDQACADAEYCTEGTCVCDYECHDTCADLSTSSEHCGYCDHACEPGQACTGGYCQPIPKPCNACEEPIELPAAGGTVTLTLDGSFPDCTLCVPMDGVLALTWAPTASGTATVKTIGSSRELALAVTDDPACVEWLECNHYYYYFDSQVTFSATAGSTYFVAAGVKRLDYGTPTTFDLSVVLE